MTHVCHLFDGTAGWEQRVAASQLLDRLPRDRLQNTLASLDPVPAGWLRERGLPVRILPRVPGLTVLSAPTVRRLVVDDNVDVIHAWGLPAALATRAAGRAATVLELFDPRLSESDFKLIRTLSRSQRFAIVCSSQILRRRLIERGVDPAACILLRPGVDFAVINKARRGSLRAQLGLSPAHFVVLTPPARSQSDGIVETVLGVRFVHYLSPDVRVIVPVQTVGARRLNEFADVPPEHSIVIHPQAGTPFEELVAIADALVVAVPGDTSTTAIAWAMAAGTAVIGSAVHAVAELIANKLNGLLFKIEKGETVAIPVARLLLNRDAQRKVKETARGQAYEVFGLRRFAEQHGLLYDNLLAGRPAGEGITDPAEVT